MVPLKKQNGKTHQRQQQHKTSPKRKPEKTSDTQKSKDYPPRGGKNPSLKDAAPPKLPPINKEFPVKDLAKKVHAKPVLHSALNAIALIEDKGKHAVQFIVGKETDVNKFKKEVAKEFGIEKELISVLQSNKLERFNAAQTVSAGCINSSGGSGSVGMFIETNNKQWVMTCEHVLPPDGKKVNIAPLYHMEGATAEVKYKKETTDIGLVELHQKVDWGRKRTSIATDLTDKDVWHYGAASGRQFGTIMSTNASATIGDTEYHNLIQLKMHAQQGDSGAPVVNVKEEVIGLIIGGDAQSDIVYCHNFLLPENKLPQAYANGMLNLLCVSGIGKAASALAAPEDPKTNALAKRREVEIWIHKGTLMLEATEQSFGEIIVDGNISVLTHYKHSFAEKDKVKQPVGKEVWFFAVPLEYLAKIDHRVGTLNASPLVAVNVSTVARTLVSSGPFKLTPCGTGTTIQPPAPGGSNPLAMARVAPPAFKQAGTKATFVIAARKRAVAKGETKSTKKAEAASKGAGTKTNKKAGFYCLINDYGQLIVVWSDLNIRPWDKVVGEGKVQRKKFHDIHKSTVSKRNIETELLVYDHVRLDPGWKWRRV